MKTVITSGHMFMSSFSIVSKEDMSGTLSCIQAILNVTLPAECRGRGGVFSSSLSLDWPASPFFFFFFAVYLSVGVNFVSWWNNSERSKSQSETGWWETVEVRFGPDVKGSEWSQWCCLSPFHILLLYLRFMLFMVTFGDRCWSGREKFGGEICVCM